MAKSANDNMMTIVIQLRGVVLTPGPKNSVGCKSSIPFPPSPPHPFLPPLPIPFLSFSPSLFSPLEVVGTPLIAAKGSGGALKLPQRVRAEHGHETHSDAC